MPDKDLLLTNDEIVAIEDKHFGKGSGTGIADACQLDICKAQLAKALPAREEIDALKVKIAELNKRLDDREADLIEAKEQGYSMGLDDGMTEGIKQERERIGAELSSVGVSIVYRKGKFYGVRYPNDEGGKTLHIPDSLKEGG